MKIFLRISVALDGHYEVRNEDGEDRTMLLFHGTADGDYFQGEILPGGVDTQVQKKGELRRLSARYILSGEDFNGDACRIFIENNGAVTTDGEIKTCPQLFTDSKALQFLEKMKLTGTVRQVPGCPLEIIIGTDSES